MGSYSTTIEYEANAGGQISLNQYNYEYPLVISITAE